MTKDYEKYPCVLVRLSSLNRAELRHILYAAWHHAMDRQAAKERKRRLLTARS
jgi:hypothetical protein